MTDSMLPNETLISQLSAFVDDELPAAENDLFVRRLTRDAELKQTMSRYQLIGEVLRTPAAGTQSSRNFSARVAAALERQDDSAALSAVAVPKVRLSRWFKPAVGMAVAASVALAAVLIVRPQPASLSAETLSTEVLQPVVLTAHKTAVNSYVVPAAANAPSAPIPAARLTNYVVAHSEFSSPLGRRNMMTGLLASEQSMPLVETVAADDSASGR